MTIVAFPSRRVQCDLQALRFSTGVVERASQSLSCNGTEVDTSVCGSFVDRTEIDCPDNRSCLSPFRLDREVKLVDVTQCDALDLTWSASSATVLLISSLGTFSSLSYFLQYEVSVESLTNGRFRAIGWKRKTKL